VPRYSAPAAFARNLALYPVILGHGFRRLVPF
jgi:ADP-ribosyl-[dinitrogen reductase] hydrolase